MNGVTMINFVCVYQKNKRTPYSTDYIIKLRNMIARNYTKPHQFYCLSNVNVPVNTIPLKHNWLGWWSKIELFRHNLFKGPVFYLDLDILICNNFEYITNKLDYKNFYMIKSVKPTSGNANSSIMSWEGDYSHLYETFQRNTQKIMSKYHKGNLIGDQAYTQASLTNMKFMDDEVGQFINWQHHMIEQKEPLESPTFTIYAGRYKKPHLQKDNPLVNKYWK